MVRLPLPRGTWTLRVRNENASIYALSCVQSGALPSGRIHSQPLILTANLVLTVTSFLPIYLYFLLLRCLLFYTLSPSAFIFSSSLFSFFPFLLSSLPIPTIPHLSLLFLLPSVPFPLSLLFYCCLSYPYPLSPFPPLSSPR